jgi:thiol-disulfide isomerase/thioredoxin
MQNMKRFLAVLALVILALCAQQPADASEYIPRFSSQTLFGEPVDESIFSGKRLTMVKIWATFCPHCISEMPDLGELARSMPEGTQLVGLIEDSRYDQDATERAKEIISDANADFTQIIAVPDMDPLLALIDSVPTTIFVDSEGKIVGDALIGSRSASSYLASINKILAETAPVPAGGCDASGDGVFAILALCVFVGARKKSD